MNEDIIRMAREAGWPEEAGVPDTGSMNLERFAELIRADEREACAKHYLEIMRNAIAYERETIAKLVKSYGTWENTETLAAAILARSNI